MATALRERLNYPTTDGKPTAETDFHRDLMYALIHRLQVWFADVPRVPTPDERAERMEREIERLRAENETLRHARHDKKNGR